jgi:hypothetical protein
MNANTCRRSDSIFERERLACIGLTSPSGLISSESYLYPLPLHRINSPFLPSLVAIITDAHRDHIGRTLICNRLDSPRPPHRAVVAAGFPHEPVNCRECFGCHKRESDRRTCRDDVHASCYFNHISLVYWYVQPCLQINISQLHVRMSFRRSLNCIPDSSQEKVLDVTLLLHVFLHTFSQPVNGKPAILRH